MRGMITRASNGRARCGDGTVAKARRWASVLEDDTVGIDGDIERLIGLYQAKFGCTRSTANAALVRRFSYFDDVGASLLEDS